MALTDWKVPTLVYSKYDIVMVTEYGIDCNKETFSLVIEGIMGNEKENMNATVVVSKGELNCSLFNAELCFWRTSEYQISEEHDATVLGTLTSPIYAGLCPWIEVTYADLKGESSFHLVRTGNGNPEWTLETTDMFDREDSLKSDIEVTCNVVDINQTAKTNCSRNIKIQIRDTNDNEPVLNFKSVLPEEAVRIKEGDVIANGTIFDKDGVNINNIKVSLEGDKRLKIDCQNLDQSDRTGTYLACDITTLAEIILDGDISFTVIASDETIRVGFGGNPKSFLMRIEKSTEYPMSEELTMPLYNTSTATIFKKNTQRGARVFAPQFKTYDARFTLVTPSNTFRVTTLGGIVYVKDIKYLRIGNVTLNVNWTDKRGNHTNIFQIVVAKENVSSPCNNGTREKVVSCLESREKDDCLGTCGLGSRGERCKWSEVTGSKFSPSVCTHDSFTCPDGYCDSLEEEMPDLCPLDCKAIQGASEIRPLTLAEGICSCHWNPKLYCVCNSNSVPAIATIPGEMAPSCDLFCQISLSGASIFIIIVFLGSAYYFKKYRILHKLTPNEPVKEDLANLNEEQVRLQHNTTLQHTPRPDYFDSKWEFPRHRLSIEETIGEGEFGKVLKARAEGIHGQEGIITVAVKTLKIGAKDWEQRDLISEYELLKEVDHPNIIKLLGACTTSDGPIYIIIEYAQHGSLRDYLRKNRLSETNFEKGGAAYLEGFNGLSPRMVLTFSWQIAKGMSYLSEMKLVHRDLAARNVLLAKDQVCKISDFGLTRDIYEDDTYLKRSKGRVPIKWMAPESLGDHIYTTKSDVWSYGIVLWELVTSAKSPYPGVVTQDLFNLLQGGYRMERPPGCSPELYVIMKACWAANPNHRPSFHSLVMQLDTMLAGRDYLDLNSRAVENLEYLGEPEFNWIFQGYDLPRAPCSCIPSRGELCEFHGKGRYENENPPGEVVSAENNWNSPHEKGGITQVSKV